MAQAPRNSSQYSGDRQQASQRPRLPPQFTPLGRDNMAPDSSAKYSPEAIAMQRSIDSGYGSEFSKSPISSSPDDPFSGSGHDLKASTTDPHKRVPSDGNTSTHHHRASREPSPALIDLDSPTHDGGGRSYDAAAPAVPPLALSSKPPPGEEDRIPRPDPQSLKHKTSYNSRPVPTASISVSQRSPPPPYSPPLSSPSPPSVGSYQTKPLERPSDGIHSFPTPPPEPLITSTRRVPNKKPTNLQNRASPGNGVSPTTSHSDAGRSPSCPAEPASTRPNERGPTSTPPQVRPATCPGSSPFPTPPTSPYSPDEDEKPRPAIESYTTDRTPNAGATPRVATPPQSTRAGAPADRQPSTPGHRMVAVMNLSPPPPQSSASSSPQSSAPPSPQSSASPSLHSSAASPGENAGYTELLGPQPLHSFTSLGLWSYLQKPARDLGPQGVSQLAASRKIPLDLRVIFGLHCKFHAMPGPGEQQSRDDQPCYGAGSLEGVWKLADMMKYSTPSAPLSAFRQFPKGKLYSVTPMNCDTQCPLQKRFDGTGAIQNELADTPCSSLGVSGLLQKLNEVFGTTYQLNNHLSSLLGGYVNKADCDFGRVYGEVRRGWFCDVDRLQGRLERGARQDYGMRKRAIDSNRGLIVQPRTPPRRVWDLYSNRVLPFWVLLSKDIPRNLWAVSHSWVNDRQRKFIRTRVNGFEWALPIPRDVELDHVRIELLNLGAEYVWLDVLCLRQQVDEERRTWLSWDSDRWQNVETLRQKEWRLDVPTIGHVFRCKPSQVVITYFSGLGRPFCVTAEMFNDERSWLNRVWTMQETTSNWLLGGLVPEEFMVRKEDLDLPTQFHDGVCSLLQVLARDPPDLFALAKVLRSRRGTHHIDQVSALGLLLKCPALPIYDTKQRCEDGWGQLVQQMSHKHRTDLLVNCPVVGNAPGTKWCPSWSQLMLGKTIPSETTVINYSEGELLNCSPISHDPSVNLGVVYWNYAYVIESCEFSIEDGRIHMHVLLGPASQSQFATDSYKTQPFLVEFSGANPLFDPDFYYAAAGMANLEYWVLGKISGHGRNMGYVQFEKRSTFRIPCARERERLWHLNPSYSDTPIRYL